MKKYIVTVPEDKRALFDEVVRENHFDIYEVNDNSAQAEGNETKSHHFMEDNLPWIEAQKLIDRNAT